MTLGTFFKDIGKGIKEVFTGFPKAVAKLITLSDDAKQIASDAANEVITVASDVEQLIAAVAKDDGASLQAIEQFEFAEPIVDGKAAAHRILVADPQMMERAGLPGLGR